MAQNTKKRAANAPSPVDITPTPGYAPYDFDQQQKLGCALEIGPKLGKKSHFGPISPALNNKESLYTCSILEQVD